MGDITAIPEPPQVYDFSRLLPEIPKFEPRKICKPKTHQTTQSLSGNKLIRTWKSDIKRKTKRRNCTWRRHFFYSTKNTNNFRWSDIWKRARKRERERGRRANKIWNRPTKIKRWTWRMWSSERIWILFWCFKQKFFLRMSKFRSEWRQYIFHWFFILWHWFTNI